MVARPCQTASVSRPLRLRAGLVTGERLHANADSVPSPTPIVSLSPPPPYGPALMGRRPAQFHYNKMDNVRGYMFTLAAESVQADDWVTEKVYQALAVGSVPVYLGAPNVANFLPCRNCIVNAADFASPAALGGHLRYLMDNATAYDALLAWTREPYRCARAPAAPLNAFAAPLSSCVHPAVLAACVPSLPCCCPAARGSVRARCCPLGP